MSRSERIYGALLHFYPRDFRDEYGSEMLLLFRDRAATEGGVRLWAQVARDLIVHTSQEHAAVLIEDIRYALRTWRRQPAVPLLAIAALTLGMGANTALFSVVHAVLLRPLPVTEPERLMLLRETNAAQGLDATAVSLPNYLSWKQQARTVDLAAYSGQNLTWTDPEFPERVEALAPTASFIGVIRAPLAAGRWFTAEEERPGQHRVAVLGHRFWRTRLGSDRRALGRRLTLNGTPYEVVGVASPEFAVPAEPDLWVPQAIDEATARRANRYLSVIGRLRPEMTRQQADAELQSIAIGLEQQFPDSNGGYRVDIVPFADSIVSTEIRTALVALLFAAGVVLLIACANVALILLSRAAIRRKEIAIRAALGAGARRIVRQLLSESVLLSLVAGGLGLLLAAAVLQAARLSLAGVVPRVDTLALNVPVVAFALAAAVLTGLVFGLAPLHHATHAVGALQASGRDDYVQVRSRVRSGLVVAQISLTTLLLIGAALSIQSLRNLQRVPAGIDTDAIVTAKLSLTRARLQNGAAIDAFLQRLTAALEGSPQVAAAGVSSAIPLSPGAFTITRVGTGSDRFVTSEWRLADAGYFRAFRIPLLRGRLFTASDGAHSPRVFVISERAARTLFGEGDPVGKPLRLENGATGEVVGVVGDVRMRELASAPEPVVYFSPSQFGFFPIFNVVVRTTGPPDAALSLIRERLKAADPQLAAFELQPMQHWVERSSSLMSIRARLASSLGAIALVLGAVGVFGVMSYLVAQSRREFAIRLVFGARPWALPFAVTAGVVPHVVGGIAAGVLAAVLAMDFARDLLFEVDPHDPRSIGIVALGVGIVALAASFVPARRAAAVDPATTLRSE